jgi:hypothetical protein
MKHAFGGNPARFCGQTTARLLFSESGVSKDLAPALLKHFDGLVPRGHCLVCTYTGNFGIPFVDIQKYSITALDKLRGSVGQTVSIEISPTAPAQEKLDLEEMFPTRPFNFIVSDAAKEAISKMLPIVPGSFKEQLPSRMADETQGSIEASKFFEDGAIPPTPETVSDGTN